MPSSPRLAPSALTCLSSLLQMGPANLCPESEAMDELALGALGFPGAPTQTHSLVKG